MSEKKNRKAGLIILCVLGLIGFGFAFFYGIMLYAWLGDKGFLGLMIGSLFGIDGSILGIVFISRGRKLPMHAKRKRPIWFIIIWTLIASLSATSAGLTFFFRQILTENEALFILLNAGLGILFWVSIYFLIFGWKTKAQHEITDPPIKEVDSASEVVTEIQ